MITDKSEKQINDALDELPEIATPSGVTVIRVRELVGRHKAQTNQLYRAQSRALQLETNLLEAKLLIGQMMLERNSPSKN